MLEWRRQAMRRRILRQAHRANLEERYGFLPRGLVRSSAARRAGRLLGVAMLAVLAGGFGPRLTESTVAEPPEESARTTGTPGQMAAKVTLPGPGEDAVASETPLRESEMAPRPIDPAVLRLGVQTIVIDAGHGGIDSGARTLTGLLEKDVALDVARRLARLLREEGFEVEMTRERDETVSLRERSARASAVRGDLFVSIHLNSIPRENHGGVETYYAGPPSDSYGEELAGAENTNSGYTLADVRMILEGVYENLHANESRRLAESVQHHVYDSLRRATPGLENRGVKTAPFVVLVTSEMPAILAEVSCMSNQEEAARLEQPSYRQRIAEALGAGLAAYAEPAHAQRIVASASGSP